MHLAYRLIPGKHNNLAGRSLSFYFRGWKGGFHFLPMGIFIRFLKNCVFFLLLVYCFVSIYPQRSLKPQVSIIRFFKKSIFSDLSVYEGREWE